MSLPQLREALLPHSEKRRPTDTSRSIRFHQDEDAPSSGSDHLRLYRPAPLFGLQDIADPNTDRARRSRSLSPSRRSRTKEWWQVTVRRSHSTPRNMRDLEGSYEYFPLGSTTENIKLPLARVLDRQGFGSELYRGKDGVVLRTATDLLPYRVGNNERRHMRPEVAAFYGQQNQQIADMLLMERHIHNVTADIRAENTGGAPVSNYHVVSDCLFFTSLQACRSI